MLGAVLEPAAPVAFLTGVRHASGDGHEVVGVHQPCADPAGEPGTRPRGVDDVRCGDLGPGDGRPPVVPGACHAGDAARTMAHASVTGSLTQRGVEPPAVEMPAWAVGTADEIRCGQGGSPPGGAVAVARQVAARGDPVEDAEAFQQGARRGSQALSDPPLGRGIRVDEDDFGTGVRKGEGGGRPRRPATSHEDVRAVARPGQWIPPMP